VDDGVELYCGSLAADYVGESQTTLKVWDKKGCPWLDGRRIETRPRLDANNVPRTYRRKTGTNSLDEVLAAKAARAQLPEYEGLEAIDKAAKILNVTSGYCRRLWKQYGYPVVTKRGKSKDGRAFWRSYVFKEHLSVVKADREAPHRAADTMTIAEAAKRLMKAAPQEITPTDVRNVITAGFLDVVKGEGVSATAAVMNGKKLMMHFRECSRVFVDQVERLFRAVKTLAKQPRWPRRRGQPSLLRRAAALVTEGPTLPARGASPRWDSAKRELWFGTVLCVSYATKQAPNQEKILASFEELGWPDRIDDPLDPGSLHKTLWSLNAKIGSNSIRFRSDGESKGILWSASSSKK
jgi:hypothetical protein